MYALGAVAALATLGAMLAYFTSDSPYRGRLAARAAGVELTRNGKTFSLRTLEVVDLRVGDVVRTGPEGSALLGWAAGPTIRRELVLDAVLRAVRRRRPRGTLIHSDQGTQYGSGAWRRFCRSNHLEPSMSRKGNCWDNAVAESFFSSLKKERIKKQIYKNRELAIADVAEYIDTFYNRTRRHSHLGGLSPEQFEGTHKRNRQRLH